MTRHTRPAAGQSASQHTGRSAATDGSATDPYVTSRIFRRTLPQLKIVAAVRGETLAQVVDALVQRELARLRADGRLAETLDGGVVGLEGSESSDGGRAKKRR